MYTFGGFILQPYLSVNTVLNINTLIWFMYFYMAISFKTLDKKTSLDQEKINCENVFNFMSQQLENLIWRFALSLG